MHTAAVWQPVASCVDWAAKAAPAVVWRHRFHMWPWVSASRVMTAPVSNCVRVRLGFLCRWWVGFRCWIVSNATRR